MRKLFASILLICISHLGSWAQTANPVTSKPMMEEAGKIYVVMLVCLLVLGGLISYLFVLDKRISRMEKERK